MNATLDMQARPAAPAGDFDPDRGPRRTVLAMVGVLALFVVVALAWAAVARLDVAVQARGAVVPPSRLQEVGSFEGGIVKELRVVPGQRVKAGELLARLDTAQADADLGESRELRLAAMAGRARVEGLLSGAAPRFDDELRRAAPALVEKETQLWRDALREHQATLAAAREGVVRRRAEIEETHARSRSLQQSLAVATESFSIEEKLFAEGAGARADYLSAQQRLLSMKAELDQLRQSLPRLQASLAEAQAAAAEADSRSRTQWGGQRTEFEARAASLGATLGGRQDRVDRRDLHSPVDGVVNRVLVPTIGGVTTPGKPLIEIVPAESRLLMTARIKPADIGFLHPGQRARVRVLAYDAATHGQLEATVERVGADAVLDERNEPYFEVQVAAAPDQLRLNGRALTVSPGMPVEASILTGERSVMDYLLKPVMRGLQRSLQER